MKIAVILPAYNEGSRVIEVLKAVRRAPSIDEIVVVNDGSTDNTVQAARSVAGVRVVNLTTNRGKGGAMYAGAHATKADILVFLDADLVGLKPEHIEALVEPVKSGKYKMSVGNFQGGRWTTDFAQRWTPNISGQRAIHRAVFEQIPDMQNARYGVEMVITKFCHHYRVPSQVVTIIGVTHPMKEEKLGWVRGLLSRAKMYTQIVRIVFDRRAPRRIRPRQMREVVPRLLRKMVANQRLKGRTNAATFWLYRQERQWQLRKSERKRVAPTK